MARPEGKSKNGVGRCTINIHSQNKRLFSVKLDKGVNDRLFDRNCIVEIGEDYFKISSVGIDYIGKSKTWTKRKSGWRGFTCVCDLTPGQYDFDKEDSNEDELIAYF